MSTQAADLANVVREADVNHVIYVGQAEAMAKRMLQALKDFDFSDLEQALTDAVFGEDKMAALSEEDVHRIVANSREFLGVAEVSLEAPRF